MEINPASLLSEDQKELAMFKQIALLMMVLVISGCAVRHDPDFSFTKIMDVPKFEKSQIFNRSEEWVALTFNSGKSVIQVKNNETGRIIGRGVITVQKNRMSAFESYKFTMIIDSKDGKSKVRFYNFTEVELGGSPSVDITGKLETKCNSMAYALKDHIENLAIETAEW